MRRPCSSASLSDPNGFVGFLEALKQDDLVKILAEPNLVTVSGRPASYQVGGEVPYPQPHRLRQHLDQVQAVRHADRLRADRAGQRRRAAGSAAAGAANSTTRLGILDRRHRRARLPRALGRHGRGDEVRPDAGHRRLAAATHRRPRSKGIPYLMRHALHRRCVPPHSQQDERGRTADHGASGTGRGDGSRPGAAVRPGHELAESRTIADCTGRATSKCRCSRGHGAAGAWPGRLRHPTQEPAVTPAPVGHAERPGAAADQAPARSLGADRPGADSARRPCRLRPSSRRIVEHDRPHVRRPLARRPALQTARDPSKPSSPSAPTRQREFDAPPGFIGPIGYDVKN